jgi:hypothetical protein
MALLRIDHLTFFGKGVGNSLADGPFNIFGKRLWHKFGSSTLQHFLAKALAQIRQIDSLSFFRLCLSVRFRVCVSFRSRLERGASVDWLLVGWLALTCRPGPSANCWFAGGLEAHARPAFSCFRVCFLFSFVCSVGLSSYPALVRMS